MSLEKSKTAREMGQYEEAQALALHTIGEELRKIRKEMEEDN